MRKPNRRETILGCVLVGAVFYTLSLDAQLKKKKAANAAAAEMVPQVADLPIAKQRVRPRSSVKHPPLQEASAWGADPFDRGFGRALGVEMPEMVSGPDIALVLKGVAVSANGRTAIVNNDVVKVGDRIATYEVTEIGIDSVVLFNPIDGSTIQLEVD